MAKKTQEKIQITQEEKYINDLVAKVRKAQEEFATFSQEQVDKIFARVATKICSLRIPLAKMAVEETGMGIFEDKVIKNHFAAEYIYNKYKNTKTCGVLEDDKVGQIMKVADPLGVIAGVIPTTNPTSTTIFKTLISLKTRNGIIFSPHPRAKKCTIETAKIMLEEAVKAGAPKDIISWIDEPSIIKTNLLMTHPSIATILATGGPGMVKAAYSSGKPALGVGAGNTPAVIDETADIQMAVNSILISKTFDNGVICASEQSVVIDKSIYKAVKEEFLAKKAYILNAKEKALLSKFAFPDGHLNGEIVGQSAYKIAQMAKIKVPQDTKVLIAEVSDVGPKEPLSAEKLSPVLVLYKSNDFKSACKTAKDLINFGGNGHTSVLYTSQNNDERIKYFSELLHTGRILINTPASHGAIGDLYNFRLEPSLTLGCGSWGGNSVSENVGVKHLMNIKTVAKRQENMLWFRVPPKIYFKRGSLPLALQELEGKKKALIITDKPLYELGYTKNVTNVLDSVGIAYQIFADVNPDPDIETVNKGLDMANSFKPDVIIALGGGSPMDAAKIVWLMYEHPEVKFEDLAMRFMDVRKRICAFPELGKKAYMVCIPTTSGTGSEVTPFSVITDNETGIKYPIADYALTPHMAIVDSDLVMSMPKSVVAAGGVDAFVHSIEAISSVFATEYTNGLAKEAIKSVFEYLPASYKLADPIARDKMHNAATLAGMAFANGMLGVCHSMAHKLGAKYHLPHGSANAMLISQVLRYNSNDAPTKQTAFAQYEAPCIKKRLADVADYLGLGGKTEDDKVSALIKKVEWLKKELGIPASLKEAGINKKEFEAQLEDLAIQAFDDQCTGANPRYPLVEEIKKLYMYAYEGKTDFVL